MKPTDIKCPFCDANLTAEDDYQLCGSLYLEEGEFDHECSSCKKTFLIEPYATWTWSVEKYDEEDEGVKL